MNVTVWAWGLTLLGLLALILFDLWAVDRGEPRDFTLRQAGTWVTFYVLLAIGFGVGLLLVAGAGYSAQFFAGYLTEYSLSVDNLFVFYVIMARFAVPRPNQHKVLLIGILIALVMRGIFIAVGAAALAEFEWLFYLFGAFLIWTAVGLVRDAPDEEEFEENLLVRWVRRIIPSTDEYDGHRMTTRAGGRRVMTPMLIVMIAIGSTDLLFALDSIPAIFGLTKEPYLVFTANAFALMGLRQLYFLLRGLLDRLVYLSKGLAIILAFIGLKLILEAMHTTWFERVPEISTGASLIVIGVTMFVTTAASLAKACFDRSAVRAAAEVDPPATGPEEEATTAGPEEEATTAGPEEASTGDPREAPTVSVPEEEPSAGGPGEEPGQAGPEAAHAGAAAGHTPPAPTAPGDDAADDARPGKGTAADHVPRPGRIPGVNRTTR